jgi:hypothetical protein
VPAVLAAATGSDWNAGGSILTFYFPIGLFIVVASILYLQFTRPHSIPGHRPPAPARTSGTESQDAQPDTEAGDAHEPPAAGT